MLWDQIEERIKGFEYATQPDRLAVLSTGDMAFCGNHRLHILTPSANGWACNCETYWRFLLLGGWCRHTVAVERILAAMDAHAAWVCQAEWVQ
ncbi:MAG TPA: hypothetical protein VJG32_22040 [Anaerolineae bacterium]|nr:hypothetical protein [Anaerolineae bacterium]